MKLADFQLYVDCTQRAQSYVKASDLNQTWSGIWIQISGLIRIRIQMSAAGFQNVVDSLLSTLIWRVSWKSAGDCMRNANKSPKIACSVVWRGKWKEKWFGIPIPDRIRTES